VYLLSLLRPCACSVSQSLHSHRPGRQVLAEVGSRLAPVYFKLLADWPLRLLPIDRSVLFDVSCACSIYVQDQQHYSTTILPIGGVDDRQHFLLYLLCSVLGQIDHASTPAHVSSCWCRCTSTDRARRPQGRDPTRTPPCSGRCRLCAGPTAMSASSRIGHLARCRCAICSGFTSCGCSWMRMCFLMEAMTKLEQIY
jgi:hypothetical protein